MRKTLQLAIFTICTSLMASCGSMISSKDKSYINGFSTNFKVGSYELISIGERNVEAMKLEMHIDPKQKRISGNSGCNSYGFTYQLDGDILDLGLGVATKMYCEKTSHIENEFFSQMAKANRFVIENENITFTNYQKEVLVTAKTKRIDNE